MQLLLANYIWKEWIRWKTTCIQAISKQEVQLPCKNSFSDTFSNHFLVCCLYFYTDPKRWIVIHLLLEKVSWMLRTKWAAFGKRHDHFQMENFLKLWILHEVLLHWNWYLSNLPLLLRIFLECVAVDKRQSLGYHVRKFHHSTNKKNISDSWSFWCVCVGRKYRTPDCTCWQGFRSCRFITRWSSSLCLLSTGTRRWGITCRDFLDQLVQQLSLSRFFSFRVSKFAFILSSIKK